MTMRRRLGALLTAVLVGTILTALGPAQPAGADTENVCAGIGAANIAAPGLFYPLVGTTTTTSGTGGGSLTLHALPKLLAFGFSTSGTFLCAPVADFTSAGGLVSGWCGHSWGDGTTNLGQRFNWVSAGTFLVVTGMLLGVVSATPDVLGGQSCATGALNFLVAGAVGTIRHCNIAKNKLATLLFSFPDPLLGLHTLTTATTNGTDTSFHLTVAGGNYHIWHKLCVHQALV